MNNQVKLRRFVDRRALEAVAGTALFYPCSGNDLATPIRLFSPFVTDFWFVDKAYFTPGHQNTRCYGFDAPANRVAPVLDGNVHYVLLDRSIRGIPMWPTSAADVDPCVLTETYRHLPSGITIRVRRRRGYGFSAFNQEVDQIGVFFYRGDSLGEGGSGNLWLAPRRVNEICAKLPDGGLIATDGSQRKRLRNRTSSGAYHQFSNAGCVDGFLSAKDWVATIKPFVDPWGRWFRCVGFAGHRYGPTLVWQVDKSRESKTRLDANRR